MSSYLIAFWSNVSKYMHFFFTQCIRIASGKFDKWLNLIYSLKFIRAKSISINVLFRSRLLFDICCKKNNFEFILIRHNVSHIISVVGADVSFYRSYSSHLETKSLIWLLFLSMLMLLLFLGIKIVTRIFIFVYVLSICDEDNDLSDSISSLSYHKLAVRRLFSLCFCFFVGYNIWNCQLRNLSVCSFNLCVCASFTAIP